ncbi:hypothetical protein KSC_085410 [Ktedonobacter sp. SOSP1-52]|nr:hypothetical protein KSC_085410 [Ktedonobacter sp. SOSP1-52]
MYQIKLALFHGRFMDPLAMLGESFKSADYSKDWPHRDVSKIEEVFLIDFW